MATKGVKVTVLLSRYASRRLIWWAKVHDKTKTTYAAQIIERVLEENQERIEELIRECAEQDNMSVAELKKQWLEEDGSMQDEE